jgi:uncharacterized protein (UPF0548 family)
VLTAIIDLGTPSSTFYDSASFRQPRNRKPASSKCAQEAGRGTSEARLFRLSAPSEDEVGYFISQQQHSAFSYSEVGASASGVPSGYNVDHNRIQLGSGEVTWRRAVEAIQGWQMFNMPWVRLYWPTAPIHSGTDVAVLVRHFGFYSLNACRVVYVVSEDGPVVRYGFAYGTLKEHAERGEERFTVEWNRSDDDDKVCYDILAFSRPHKALAKLGYPLSRMLQSRFAQASKAAMLAAACGK